jgi:hypothetical protein
MSNSHDELFRAVKALTEIHQTRCPHCGSECVTVYDGRCTLCRVPDDFDLAAEAEFAADEDGDRRREMAQEKNR